LAVVVQPSIDPSWYEDLPAYLLDPPAPRRSRVQWLRDALAATEAQPVGSTRPVTVAAMPYGGQPTKPSPVFARMVPLHPVTLSGALDAWWSARARSGTVTVHHQLQLGRPEPDGAHGWTMKGRVRRLTSLHWVPVRLELWPLHEHFTRMTLTPQSHVFTSRRYFRVGHTVLDRLSADLVELSTRLERTAT
jgi:hypothetical protein